MTVEHSALYRIDHHHLAVMVIINSTVYQAACLPGFSLPGPDMRRDGLCSFIIGMTSPLFAVLRRQNSVKMMVGYSALHRTDHHHLAVSVIINSPVHQAACLPAPAQPCALLACLQNAKFKQNTKLLTCIQKIIIILETN